MLPLHAVTGSSSADLAALPPRNRHPTTRTGTNPTLPRHALYGRSRYSSSARVDQRDDSTWREREEERALERRRYIYREGLYAKHVASNRYTGFKPFSPQTFANNVDLKAKVIKFIRREVRFWARGLPACPNAHRPRASPSRPQLQVFPAVDVAFLTTYLVSIASQLDLRSPSAIRLISDFLSEQDAQHLVHEISTFARSPFSSLEGYDRFVQYGRPQREAPKEAELDALVHDPADLGRDAPRFEAHMRRRRAEEQAAANERPRPPPPVSGSMSMARRPVEQDRGYGPPRDGGHRRSSGPTRSRRALSPPREPDWRDRDQRYTGSYYASSESRRSHRGRSSRGPARDQHSHPRHPDRRERREGAVDDSYPSAVSTRYNARDERMHSPGRRRDHRRTPSPPRKSGTGSSSRKRRDSPPPAGSARGRSRSRTPSERGTTTPSPSRSPSPNRSAADEAGRPRSTVAAVGRLGEEHERPHTAATEDLSGSTAKARLRPTLAIFGAAKRLLGNGRVVTLSQDGRASLQPQSEDPPPGEADGLAAPAEQPRQQDSYVPARPGPTTPNSLRAKLQARLTAEYREALASRSNDATPASLAAGLAGAKGDKSDLRSLLQSRLQAEKALAYEDLVRSRAASSLAEARGQAAAATRAPTMSLAAFGDEFEDGTTTFSQATRDLLMARLEEERLLAHEEFDAGADAFGTGPASGSVWDSDAHFSYGYEGVPDSNHAEADVRVASPDQEETVDPPPANKSESSLRAALLAKRQANLEAELKKRSGELKEKMMRRGLMQQRRRSSGTAAAGSAATEAPIGETMAPTDLQQA